MKIWNKMKRIMRDVEISVFNISLSLLTPFIALTILLTLQNQLCYFNSYHSSDL